ncbi:MAG: STAS domain-containing protein [Phycisphaerae bacterium]|jgi:anti-sigma B factor antagonist|nr:STAS domain-containing protein [Phycisphaerae bacterium]
MTDHSSPPKVDIEWIDEDVVVRITGDIDAARAAAAQQPVLELLDKSPGRIVVNFQNVAYMDSAGLASFVKLLSRARKRNVELHLVALSEMLKGLFEITRLDTVFNISDSEEAALE